MPIRIRINSSLVASITCLYRPTSLDITHIVGQETGSSYSVNRCALFRELLCWVSKQKDELPAASQTLQKHFLLPFSFVLCLPSPPAGPRGDDWCSWSSHQHPVHCSLPNSHLSLKKGDFWKLLTSYKVKHVSLSQARLRSCFIISLGTCIFFNLCILFGAHPLR